MDIRDWLQDVADREPPEEQEQRGILDHLPPTTKHSRSQVVKRRRLSNDAKHEGAHRPGHSKRRHRVAHSSSPDRVQRAPESDTSASDESSQDSESRELARAKVTADSFERRARHKTRPDRYEAKPRGKKDRRSREEKTSKSKSKHRKSRRAADGARATDLVQSFQLKNGAKNNRLTLQPEARVGIFNHGKASVPVAASGPGLPDLVFNEMRFLSRPKDSETQHPVHEAPSKRKKSRKELRDEEISTYFRKVTAERQPGQDDHDQSRGREAPVQATIETVPRQPEQSQHHGVLEPSNERFEHTNPAKDSAQVSQERQRTRDTSNSYYTWSDSVQKAQPASLRFNQSRPSRTSNDPQGVRHEHNRDEAHQVSNPAYRKTRSVPRRSPSIRGRVQLLPELNGRRHRPPYLESALGSITSAPLPQQRKAESPFVPLIETPRRALAHHTSDILNLRMVPPASIRSLSLPRGKPELVDKENVDPTNSTPTSKLLREALYAVARPQQYLHSGAVHQSPNSELRELTADQSSARATSRMRKSDSSVHANRHGRSVRANSPIAEIPCRGFTRIHAAHPSQTAQRLLAAPAGPIPWFAPTRLAPAVPFADRYTEQIAEHAGLDNATHMAGQPGQSTFVEYIGSRTAEEFVYDRVTAPFHDQYDQDDEFAGHQSDWQNSLQAGHELDGSMEYAYDPAAPTEPAEDEIYPEQTFTHIDAEGPGFANERPMLGDAVEDEAIDHMPGFWRPNILY
ncbi:hypothetical protein CBER1_06510 [Cercospora berteroae]|uniref:Uncharacterized protein n=1 Tax=Cercospora berteroae TaxID=357750 RepID=A0A2S6BTK0_9PEZI|nr:hypothetical protein CBER1_06510 [Cercospora berteroae]